ncbi:MAG TPA: DUF4468 domain-containing protein, partial [Segetibacter sp.]
LCYLVSDMLMRTLLPVMLVIFFQLESSAQFKRNQIIMWPVEDSTDKIVFYERVNIPGANEDAIYRAAKTYLANTFKSEKDTITSNDNTKSITCKGAFFIPVEQLGERGKGYVAFTLLVNCISNSFYYKLNNLHHFPLTKNCVYGGPLENDKTISGGMLFPQKYWNEEKAKTFYKIQTTIEQLKETISKNGQG